MARKSRSDGLRSEVHQCREGGLEGSGPWLVGRKCCPVLQMSIEYQPAGNGYRDTASSDSCLPRYFLIERVYCQMLTSSAINRSLLNQKSTNSVGSFSGSVPVSNSTEDTPLPGVCLECHEDSPVVRSPHPKLLLIQIMTDCDCFENVVQVWTLSRCCRGVYVSGWGRESSLLYAARTHYLSLPHRYEYISLGFDTMYKLITTSLFSFCLQHSSVLVTFPGHKSFYSCFGCDVTVCSVR